MSVREPASQLIPMRNNWTITDYGPIRHMVAKRDGAGLRYIQPHTGRTSSIKFVKNSVVTHFNDGNILSYSRENVIPFHIPESQPASILNEFDKTEIVALAEDAAGLL